MSKKCPVCKARPAGRRGHCGEPYCAGYANGVEAMSYALSRLVKTDGEYMEGEASRAAGKRVVRGGLKL